jgi:hypothetical protein
MPEYMDAGQTVILWRDRLGDGVDVVVEPDHPLWASALAAGPTPYAAPVPTQDAYRRAVQAHIDATAIARLYDSGTSCASYVASTNATWAAEAAAFVAWRDEVWAQVYELWADPPDPVPTPAALIASLPEIDWP